MERTGPQVHVAPVRCPYCHEGIPRGEAPAVCAECHALHHAACMSEHGACAACGKKTSSPEDSKLAAALRARASARLEPKKPPPPPDRSGELVIPFALGAALGAALFLGLGYPNLAALALAAPCGLVGLVIGQVVLAVQHLFRR